MGALVSFLGIASNPIALGRLLAGISLFTYTGSMLSWWKAGKEYEKDQLAKRALEAG